MKFQAYFQQEMNMKNDPVGVHPIYSSPKYSPLHPRHHAERTSDVMRRCLPNPSGNYFSGFDDGLLARAEALAAGDVLCSVVKGGHQSHMSAKNDHGYNTPHTTPTINGSMHPSPYPSGSPSTRSLSHHGMDHNEFLDQISAAAVSISGVDPLPQLPVSRPRQCPPHRLPTTCSLVSLTYRPLRGILTHQQRRQLPRRRPITWCLTT